MALLNSYVYVKTTFDWAMFEQATQNKFRVVSYRPYVDKKGKLNDGYVMTLTVLHDDHDYGVDKNGEKRFDNRGQNFDVTVLTRKSVNRGDVIKLIGFDQEHSYVIKYDLILRFKDFEVIPTQRPLTGSVNNRA